MERTQIYLAKSQIKRLKQVAQKKKTTLSELVRDAVEVQYGIERPSPKERGETFLEAARRISGLGEKGPKDLSSRLDKYLYGDI